MIPYPSFHKWPNCWGQREVAARGWGLGVGSQYLMGTEFRLGKLEKFRGWVVLMVTQQCECT